MRKLVNEIFVAPHFTAVRHAHMPGDPGAACFDTVIARVGAEYYALYPALAPVDLDDGTQYVPARYEDAYAMAAKVQARGSVDLAHWDHLPDWNAPRYGDPDFDATELFDDEERARWL